MQLMLNNKSTNHQELPSAETPFLIIKQLRVLTYRRTWTYVHEPPLLHHMELEQFDNKTQLEQTDKPT